VEKRGTVERKVWPCSMLFKMKYTPCRLVRGVDTLKH
jgi:hypothetical protein